MAYDYNPEQELMIITAEECGELAQACSKILRFGLSLNSKENLINELGDLQCMINLMQEWDVVSWQEIDARSEIKRKKLSKYSQHLGDSNERV